MRERRLEKSPGDEHEALNPRCTHSWAPSEWVTGVFTSIRVRILRNREVWTGESPYRGDRVAAPILVR
jgi:hypothetical protein